MASSILPYLVENSSSVALKMEYNSLHTSSFGSVHSSLSLQYTGNSRSTSSYSIHFLSCTDKVISKPDVDTWQKTLAWGRYNMSGFGPCCVGPLLRKNHCCCSGIRCKACGRGRCIQRQGAPSKHFKGRLDRCITMAESTSSAT